MRPDRYSILRKCLLAVTICVMLIAADSAVYAQHGLQFNGSNQYVTFGTATALGAKRFTLETWFKRTGAGASTTTGTGGIANAIPLVTKGRGEGESPANLNMNYFLGINSSNNVLVADFEDSVNGGNHPIYGVTPISNNVWYHASVTYDGSTWRLYLNGQLDSTKTYNVLPEATSIQHAGIATAMTSNGTAAGYFAGEMDEVRIWNRALSQEEIQTGMGVEITSGTGLLGRWGLNEGSGTTAGNSTGGVNGTLTGSPTWTTPGSPFVPQLSAKFQEGLNGYAGTVDNYLRQSQPTTTQGAGATIEWDTEETAGNPSTQKFGLLRFDNIFGSGGGQVPAGVTVTYASITYNISNVTTNTTNLNEVAINWDETTTWNTFGAAAGVDASDYGALVGNPPAAATGPALVNVTSSLAAWSISPSSNRGWIFIPGGTDGAVSTSSEGTAAERPLLTVVYNSPPPAPPDIPVAIAATGASATSFTANWNAATGATSYRLDVSTDAGFGSFVLGYQDLTVAGTSQSVTGLNPTTPYHYRVRAYNTAGTSANSNVIDVTTLTPAPPAAPTGLSATALSYRTIQLGWTDNSNNEEHFEVDRSTNGGSTFSLLATLGAGVNSYIDAAVGTALEFCYRVRATNANGNSDYTSTQCATTPAEPNTSLDLGSSNAYVTFGTAMGLATQNFTVEVWFKRTGAGVPNTTGTGGLDIIPILAKGSPESDGSNVDANYILGIASPSYVLAADFEEGTSSTSVGLNHPVTGTTVIQNNVWYHAAATFAANGDFKLYLNGNLEGSLALGSLVWPQGLSIQHAALGAMVRSNGNANGFFAGVLDEARIWNVAHSQAEIQASMNSRISTPQTGLLGRYGFGEGSGTTIYCAAGASINGTLNLPSSCWARVATSAL